MSEPQPGVDPRPPLADTTIYVTEQGTQLGVTDNRYVVRDIGDDDSELLAEFPVAKVETICVFGAGVDVTAYARSTADSNDTIINYFTVNGRFRGRFVPEGTTIAALHRQQHELPDDERLSIARALVAGKVLNAIEHLRRKHDLDAVGEDLLDAPEKTQRCEAMNQLRGVEGAAAREYFGHVEETLRDGWKMERRTTRPPEDHTNSLLSLTYTMVQREVESALRQVNLDPYVGLFHAERHGRPALALDLLEEFRTAFADRLVARLINRQTISHDQFTVENRLTDDAFDRYLAKYDAYMDESVTHAVIGRELTRREVIRMQARLLRKRIVGDIDDYPPYRTDRP